MRRSVAVVGRAAPDQAWERYAEIAQWPSWAPPIRTVVASAARLSTGVTGVVRGPFGLRIPFTVLSVDPAVRTWTWRVRALGVRMELSHEVLPRPGGGSVATLTVDASAPLALLYPELARVALARLVA